MYGTDESRERASRRSGGNAGGARVRAKRSPPRERSATCLCAVYGRHVARVSESGVRGQSSNRHAGEQSEARLANGARFATRRASGGNRASERVGGPGAKLERHASERSERASRTERNMPTRRLLEARCASERVGVWGQSPRIKEWRRRPDLNRRWRFCRPLPYHLATAPENRAKGRGQKSKVRNGLPLAHYYFSGDNSVRRSEGVNESLTRRPVSAPVPAERVARGEWSRGARRAGGTKRR